MTHTRLVLGDEWDDLPEYVDVSLGGKVMPYAPVTNTHKRIYDRCINRVGQLEAENEKLRELCRHLYTCNQYCDREDSDGGCSACPYQLLEYDCGFEERLLELGIEVD